jgi:Zn/Cd-binding protein ZinT
MPLPAEHFHFHFGGLDRSPLNSQPKNAPQYFQAPIDRRGLKIQSLTYPHEGRDLICRDFIETATLQFLKR